MPFRTHNIGLFVLVPCACSERLRTKKNYHLPKQMSLASTVVVMCLLADFFEREFHKNCVRNSFLIKYTYLCNAVV